MVSRQVLEPDFKYFPRSMTQISNASLVILIFYSVPCGNAVFSRTVQRIPDWFHTGTVVRLWRSKETGTTRANIVSVQIEAYPQLPHFLTVLGLGLAGV